MIDGLKPYPEYVESGLQWLGPIPSHWKLLRSKYLFRGVDERSVTGRETRLSMSQRHGLIPSSRMEAHRLVSESQVGAKICEPGYLVLNRLKAHLGVFALASQRGLVSPDYTVLRPTRDFEARYFEAFYRTPECRVELYRRAKGIVEGFWRLYTDDFNDIRVPMPDREEQATMIKFLDYATGRIERAIRAKKKLIALLHEQKQAIIHRAVTRGLDPNVPLKPSGIPWLGDIPQHWEVMPLKRLAWFKGGAGFPISEQAKADLEIPFLKVSDMTRAGNDTWIETQNNTVSRKTATRMGAHIFPARTIIFPKVGGAMLTNKRRLLRRPSCIDNNVMGCVVQRGDLEFVFLLMQQLDLGRLSKPGPVPAISEGEVREIKVVFPPLVEQPQLVNFVHKETAQLDAATTRTEREIELLGEYRTRLAADVVTGKLDVRAAARDLPADADEPPTSVSDESEELIEEEQLA